ncbi:unnamed protein product, partial [Closterium sp. NIES-53]
MASLRVLAFDHEGRLVAFDTWLDDLQLYLLSDTKDSVSLFDHVSGAATAPPATADIATRSHTVALGRMLLPYLFPELSAFATVEDPVSHLRASDARYRAALPAEDHFLSLDPTSLTVDLLEQHLIAAETTAVAVDVSVAEDVGAASASAKCRSSKGKGGKGGGGGSGGGGGGSGSSSLGSGGGGAAVGQVEGVGVVVATVGAAVGVAAVVAVGLVALGLMALGLALGVLVLEVASVSSSSIGARPSRPNSFLHTQHRCFSRLNDAWRAEFGDDVELPCWADLLRSRIAIFDLDFDAILSAMYAFSVCAEGDCYWCVPPDPGIATTALGASESGTLPGTAPIQTLHTFTSRYFFCDSTTLTPLPAPISVRQADPSGGPVVARSSTVLPCPTVPSGSLSGLHLPSFSTNL